VFDPNPRRVSGLAQTWAAFPLVVSLKGHGFRW